MYLINIMFVRSLKKKKKHYVRPSETRLESLK